MAFSPFRLPVHNDVCPDRPGTWYRCIAIWVNQILDIWLQEEARPNRERVIPFKRHLEVLNADREVPLNFFHSLQISTVRAIDDSISRKILWAAPQSTVYNN